MLWHLLKYYMAFVIAVYFKRTKVKNAHYIKVKGPVILAMNHPNAFMDSVAFTGLIYPPRLWYLARGDAFKKGIVTTLLESLGIIPIFRIQDGGKEGLKKNDETYERVNALLKQNQKIIIFAEGLCIQERRLRPLKKGVPRMVFGAMEAEDLKDLTVVPVGVNYSNPSQFRGTLLYNVGPPLHVSDYMASYKEAPAKTMNQFLADLAPRMKELIVHIDHKKSEAVIASLEEIYKYDFFKKNRLDSQNLEHDFAFSTKLTQEINRAEITHPEKVREIEEKATSYLNELKTYGLRDDLLIPEKQKNIHYLQAIVRAFFILVTVPIYIRGILGNYIPYKLTEVITDKKVKVIEFKASFHIGIGAALILLFYGLQFFVAYCLAPNGWWVFLVILNSCLSGAFCLYLSPFRKKTKGMFNVLRLKARQPNTFKNLSEQRAQVIRLFEALEALNKLSTS